MKLRVIVDVDVSKTIAETIERNGFTVCRDGSSMQYVYHIHLLSRAVKLQYNLYKTQIQATRK